MTDLTESGALVLQAIRAMGCTQITRRIKNQDKGGSVREQ